MANITSKSLFSDPLQRSWLGPIEDIKCSGGKCTKMYCHPEAMLTSSALQGSLQLLFILLQEPGNRRDDRCMWPRKVQAGAAHLQKSAFPKAAGLFTRFREHLVSVARTLARVLWLKATYWHMGQVEQIHLHTQAYIHIPTHTCITSRTFSLL